MFNQYTKQGNKKTTKIKNKGKNKIILKLTKRKKIPRGKD